MKDFLGNKVNIGDTIVGISQSRTSSNLFKGRVLNVMDKMLQVEQENGHKRNISGYKVVVVKEA